MTALDLAMISFISIVVIVGVSWIIYESRNSGQ